MGELEMVGLGFVCKFLACFYLSWVSLHLLV